MEKPVTKKELQKELGATKKELREEIGATKKELREEIAELSRTTAKGFEVQGKQIAQLSILAQKALKRSDEALFKIDAVILSNEQISKSNDYIAKEIKDMREEQAAIIGGRKRMDNTILFHGDTLRDHEKRIKKLEKASVHAKR